MERPIVPVITFSGHRTFYPKGDPRCYKDNDPWHVAIRQRMATLISGAIRYNKTRTFMCGGALNVDTWAADIILDHKMVQSDIRLVIAAPYPHQEKVWKSLEAQERYRQILDVADEVVYVSERSPADKQEAGKMLFRRDDYMVDRTQRESGGLIAVYDGRHGGGTYHTIWYATEKVRMNTICYIDPNQYKPQEAIA